MTTTTSASSISQQIKENQPLRNAVDRALDNYFSQIGESNVQEVYDMVLAEVEAPLFETMMRFTNGNQSRAAILLGISRGTLRKKLKIYDLHNVR